MGQCFHRGLFRARHRATYTRLLRPRGAHVFSSIDSAVVVGINLAHFVEHDTLSGTDNTGNRLEVLPPSLSQLTQLEMLTLSSNHVYQLPDEMVGLAKLKVRREPSRASLLAAADSYHTELRWC